MSSQSSGIDGRQLCLGGETQILEAEFPPVNHAADNSSGNGSFSTGELGSCSLQSELVDGAISRISCSLPGEVTRITALQRHQNSQISALQDELRQVEEQKRKAIGKSVEIKEEIEHVRRQTFFLEEDIGKMTKRCIQHKNDIMALVKDCEAKRRRSSARQFELQTTKSKLVMYRQKLDDLNDATTATDTFTAVQTEIKRVEERLASLKDKKDHMEQNPEETNRICCGSVERDLKDKVAQLNTQSDQLSEDVKQLQQKVDSIRAKQEQVKQAITVLRKRNVAQVIRLKRQVKEQHLRHRQWTEQRRLLRQNVDALNHKLQSA